MVVIMTSQIMAKIWRVNWLEQCWCKESIQPILGIKSLSVSHTHMHMHMCMSAHVHTYTHNKTCSICLLFSLLSSVLVATVKWSEEDLPLECLLWEMIFTPMMPPTSVPMVPIDGLPEQSWVLCSGRTPSTPVQSNPCHCNPEVSLTVTRPSSEFRGLEN